MSDFEEYINGDNPQKAELARNWSIACGLQAAAGLHASDFYWFGKRNIEGEITQEDVKRLLWEHYKSERLIYPSNTEEEYCL